MRMHLNDVIIHSTSNIHLITVGASSVCFLYSILFMKLWSYVQVNKWCRESVRSKKAKHKSRKRRTSVSIAEIRMFIFIIILIKSRNNDFVITVLIHIDCILCLNSTKEISSTLYGLLFQRRKIIDR